MNKILSLIKNNKLIIITIVVVLIIGVSAYVVVSKKMKEDRENEERKFWFGKTEKEFLDYIKSWIGHSLLRQNKSYLDGNGENSETNVGLQASSIWLDSEQGYEISEEQVGRAIDHSRRVDGFDYSEATPMFNSKLNDLLIGKQIFSSSYINLYDSYDAKIKEYNNTLLD